MTLLDWKISQNIFLFLCIANIINLAKLLAYINCLNSMFFDQVSRYIEEPEIRKILNHLFVIQISVSVEGCAHAGF